MSEFPDTIYNVSLTQFSIARSAGAIKINGKKYMYNEKDDTLVLHKRKKRQSKKTEVI